MATIPSFEICVEKHNNKNILTYVREKLSLNIYDEEILAELEKDITDKVLGVFQWACLIISTVIK